MAADTTLLEEGFDEALKQLLYELFTEYLGLE
jgi:hypothetical protein